MRVYKVSGAVADRFGRPISGSAFSNEETSAVSPAKARANIQFRMMKKHGYGVKLLNPVVKDASGRSLSEQVSLFQ